MRNIGIEPEKGIVINLARKNGDRQNADLSKNQVYWTGNWTIKHADSKQTPGLQRTETADWNKTHRAIFRDLNHQWYTCRVCCDVLQLIAIKHTETSSYSPVPWDTVGHDSNYTYNSYNWYMNYQQQGCWWGTIAIGVWTLLIPHLPGEGC